MLVCQSQVASTVLRINIIVHIRNSYFFFGLIKTKWNSLNIYTIFTLYSENIVFAFFVFPHSLFCFSLFVCQNALKLNSKFISSKTEFVVTFSLLQDNYIYQKRRSIVMCWWWWFGFHLTMQRIESQLFTVIRFAVVR